MCIRDSVIGVDEAGRGPLAGPVVAAAVVLKDYVDIKGIDDSKKLSSIKRERVYEDIIEGAVSYGIGIVQPREIDEIDVYKRQGNTETILYLRCC